MASQATQYLLHSEDASLKKNGTMNSNVVFNLDEVIRPPDTRALYSTIECSRGTFPLTLMMVNSRNNRIDFTVDGVASSTMIAPGNYKDGSSLAAAICSAFNVNPVFNQGGYTTGGGASIYMQNSFPYQTTNNLLNLALYAYIGTDAKLQSSATANYNSRIVIKASSTAWQLLGMSYGVDLPSYVSTATNTTRNVAVLLFPDPILLTYPQSLLVRLNDPLNRNITTSRIKYFAQFCIATAPSNSIASFDVTSATNTVTKIPDNLTLRNMEVSLTDEHGNYLDFLGAPWTLGIVITDYFTEVPYTISLRDMYR